MANVNNPSGFIYEGRFSDESPPVHDFEMAASTTLTLGDPVKFTGGYVELASAGDTILGVFLGAAAVDGTVYTDQSGITSGAGENPVVKIVLALPDVYFRVQDAAASPAIAVRGIKCDFSGTTGVVVVNSGVTTNGDVRLLNKAGTDNISGNEYGQYMDWLGIFQKTVFNGAGA